MDIDGTALNTPYPLDLNFSTYIKIDDRDVGLKALTKKYNVYFLTARKFEKAFTASCINLWPVEDELSGIITNLYHKEKEHVARALDCIALVDNDYRVIKSNYTIAIDSPWLQSHKKELPANLVIVKHLGDRKLLEELKKREKSKLPRENDLNL